MAHRICRVCATANLEPLLDFGPQPLCNRFLSGPDEPEALFPLALGCCRRCGVTQLLDVAPAGELMPRFGWITYREAEGHLDDLVDRIAALPGLTPESRIVGLSYKDDSTLARLSARGFRNTRRLDPERDCGAPAEAGVETIQDLLTPGVAAACAARAGAADVVIARHILEHAHDPRAFVAALTSLLASGGVVVIEVPDCGKGISERDYTVVWEEHALYFTEPLFESALRALGLASRWTKTYPYSHENSLVAIASRGRPELAARNAAVAEMERVALFATGFESYRTTVRHKMSELRSAGQRIAVFGAGHLSCTWLNVMSVGRCVDFVVDDDPHKRDLVMPGSRLSIRPSPALVDGSIDVCLLSLNQESEARVLERSQGFVAHGGTFMSLFPGRSNAFVCTQ